MTCRPLPDKKSRRHSRRFTINCPTRLPYHALARTRSMSDKSTPLRFTPGDRIGVTCRSIAGLSGAVSDATDDHYLLTIDSLPAGVYLCLNGGVFESLERDHRVASFNGNN